MREGDSPAVGGLRAVLGAEAFASVTTVVCLAALAGLAGVAQQDPAGTPGVARTLTADMIDVLRWGLVVGLGLRGLGGLVQGGLTPACGRFPWAAYGALGAGAIRLAGAALASVSRTPETAGWSTFMLVGLALSTCGVSVPVLRWMAGHHHERVAQRLTAASAAAAAERACQWQGPASDDG